MDDSDAPVTLAVATDLITARAWGITSGKSPAVIAHLCRLHDIAADEAKSPDEWAALLDFTNHSRV